MLVLNFNSCRAASAVAGAGCPGCWPPPTTIGQSASSAILAIRTSSIRQSAQGLRIGSIKATQFTNHQTITSKSAWRSLAHSEASIGSLQFLRRLPKCALRALITTAACRCVLEERQEASAQFPAARMRMTVTVAKAPALKLLSAVAKGQAEKTK